MNDLADIFYPIQEDIAEIKYHLGVLASPFIVLKPEVIAFADGGWCANYAGGVRVVAPSFEELVKEFNMIFSGVGG
jgi:hypothetical protein